MLDAPEKKFSISFSTENAKFCLSVHYNLDNSYLFVNEKETFKFEADNKIVNFLTQFSLAVFLMDLEMYMTFQLITILLINLTS